MSPAPVRPLNKEQVRLLRFPPAIGTEDALVRVRRRGVRSKTRIDRPFLRIHRADETRDEVSRQASRQAQGVRFQGCAADGPEIPRAVTGLKRSRSTSSAGPLQIHEQHTPSLIPNRDLSVTLNLC